MLICRIESDCTRKSTAVAQKQIPGFDPRQGGFVQPRNSGNRLPYSANPGLERNKS